MNNVPAEVVQRAKRLMENPVMLAKAMGYADMGAIHGEWMRKILGGRGDMTLQAHRGSYKTTCLCVCIPLLMVTQRRKNIIFLRKTDNDIAEVIKNVRRICEEPIFKTMVAALSGGEELTVKSFNQSELTLSCYGAPRGAAQLLGIGIGGSLTGKHADIIITDDIVNMKDRMSKAERDRTKAVYMELQNVRNRGGRIINTGTPWHQDDAFSLMPEPMRYDCYQTGLIGQEQLEQIKKSMTPSLFAANYELRHIASDDVIFMNPQVGADIANVEQGDGHIDAAYHGEDYTAYTLCRLVDGKYYIYGRLWRKHIDDVLEEILRVHHGLNGGRIHCENNGDKGYLGRDLRNRGERCVIYSEKMNKYLKITSYLKFEWENVIFVQGTDEEYIRQVCDYNENAEHDDAPDSLASIIRIMPSKRFRSKGYAHLFGGDSDENVSGFA